MFNISVYPKHLMICRFLPDIRKINFASVSPFFALTLTEDELSVVCEEEIKLDEIEKIERGWRALKIEGPFPLTSTGVLASVVEPLSNSGLSIFAISTFDTDYVLVKDIHLEKAIFTLTQNGHIIIVN